MKFLAIAFFLTVALPMPGIGMVLNGTFENHKCHLYFYWGVEPMGLKLSQSHPVRICQCYKGMAHFATLFDQARRIPLYSAYVYGNQDVIIKGVCGNLSGSKCGKRKGWCIEPQLVRLNANPNMEKSPSKNSSSSWFEEVSKVQAVNQDYIRSDFTRGHINPNGHHNIRNSRDATFTLTNIVPQPTDANEEWARGYENKLAALTSGCSRTYVITGAIPGNNKSPQMKGRVNIPQYIWSAYCCVDNNGNPMRSGAHLLRNKNNNFVDSMTLLELQEKLTAVFEGEVAIFQNSCQAQG
nr:PREDICTED: endonuclease domain-containing 1 protein-like [Latimeria chalumnae]|eukprot:XP_006012973.2 PREDICTED: endonuclease domain-containing 1 protein-like [Latimeria chalumnae]